MIASLTERAAAISGDMLLFLLTRPGARLTGAVCQSPVLVDRGDGVAEPCRRPLWGGDGHANWGSVTHEHPMCSRCAHAFNAFHGAYVTMKANPAAAKLDNTGLARLFISRGLDSAPLPDVGAHLPDTFPSSWALHSQPGPA